MPSAVFALEEMTDQEIMEAPLETEESKAPDISYINDIEILGANIIKPEFILKKMKLQKGDLYDKDVMQQDLKMIYRLGFFTERMKMSSSKNRRI